VIELVGLVRACLISSRRMLGSTTPATLSVTWSCSSKMSLTSPSKRSAQT
jgi:hypothetical protein